MPSSPLIVPVVVPTGSLHFATIQPDGTVQDVIGALLAQQEVILEILGDLDDTGWALQKIRVEKNGRQWEEKDLENLGDGMPRHLCFLGGLPTLRRADILQVYWTPRYLFPPCSIRQTVPKTLQLGTFPPFHSHPTCIYQPCASCPCILHSP